MSIDVEDPPAGLTVAVDSGAPRPVPVRLHKGSGTHLLVFHAPGYRPHSLRLDAARDLLLLLSMKKVGARGKETRERATANNNRVQGDRAKEALEAAPVEPPPRKRSSAITDL